MGHVQLNFFQSRGCNENTAYCIHSAYPISAFSSNAIGSHNTDHRTHPTR